MLDLSLVTIQIIYIIAAVMAFLLAGVLWRNREKPGATALVVANLCIVIWSTSQLVMTFAIMTVESTSMAIVTNWLLFPTIATTTVAVFVFALEYTGRERYVTPKTLAVLAVYPLTVAFFVIINPGGAFYTDFTAAVHGIGEDTSHLQGPAFAAHTLVGYTLVAAVFLMIIELLFRSGRPLYRGQAVALLLALATPVAFNVLTITGIVTFDLTVLGFICTSGLFTVAIVRYGLIDATPIARQKVIESVRDGMFVVDTADTVLDTNPALRSLIDREEGSIVGTSARTLFEGVPAILETYRTLTRPIPEESAGKEDLTREEQLTYGERHLNVQSTPIYDDRDRHIGWLFLVHDVTELVQRERDLENQVEKLDQFASIVSHDLRNPLNVARGYVQQTQATGNLDHLEKTEDAMERMETIISEALALAREGNEVTELETVSLESAAQNAWANVETSGASISVEDVRIRADAKRLQRLLENLFRNSIEHGVDSENGYLASDHTISIGFEDDGPDRLSIFVADNGVGISDEKLSEVFEGGYTTNENGTGLGLAIVEQIASSHGWEVTATHSDSGGARFELHHVAKPV